MKWENKRPDDWHRYPTSCKGSRNEGGSLLKEFCICCDITNTCPFYLVEAGASAMLSAVLDKIIKEYGDPDLNYWIEKEFKESKK